MLKNILFGASVVVAVVFGVLYFNSLALFGAAGTGQSFYQTPNFLQGLYAGTLGQFKLSNAGVLTDSGAATFSGTHTLTGDVAVSASASSTLAIGNNASGLGAGCLVLGNSAGTTSTPVYITAAGTTVSATTTKPAICK